MTTTDSTNDSSQIADPEGARERLGELIEKIERGERAPGPARRPDPAIVALRRARDASRRIHHAAQEVDGALADAVADARAADVSWAEIGLALEITRQSAHKRFRAHVDQGQEAVKAAQASPSG